MATTVGQINEYLAKLGITETNYDENSIFFKINVQNPQNILINLTDEGSKIGLYVMDLCGDIQNKPYKNSTIQYMMDSNLMSGFGKLEYDIDNDAAMLTYELFLMDCELSFQQISAALSSLVEHADIHISEFMKIAVSVEEYKSKYLF